MRYLDLGTVSNETESISPLVSSMDCDSNGLCTCDDAMNECLVLTDHEADCAFKESVESYVDDCVLDQIPENLRYYFNLDSFTRDVEISDGRGHMLSSYDGEENEINLGNEYYYIYRQ